MAKTAQTCFEERRDIWTSLPVTHTSLAYRLPSSSECESTGSGETHQKQVLLVTFHMVGRLNLKMDLWFPTALWCNPEFLPPKYSHNLSLHHPLPVPCGCSSLGRSLWQYWAFCHCSLDAHWPQMLLPAYGSLCGQMGRRPIPTGHRSLCCPERGSGGDETPFLSYPGPHLPPCAFPHTGGIHAQQREVCASGCVPGPGCSS